MNIYLTNESTLLFISKVFNNFVVISPQHRGDEPITYMTIF